MLLAHLLQTASPEAALPLLSPSLGQPVSSCAGACTYQCLADGSALRIVYNNLGYQWATTILAFLTLVMVPFPYVDGFPSTPKKANTWTRYIFFKYGKRIRSRSKFASVNQ